MKKKYSVILLLGDENAFDCFIVESDKIELSDSQMNGGYGYLYNGMKLIDKIDGKNVETWAVVIKTFESEKISNIKLNNAGWEIYAEKFNNDYWKNRVKFKSIEEELKELQELLIEEK